MSRHVSGDMPMRYSIAVLLIILAINSQAFCQLKTTFKYSEDLEHQIRMTKEVHEQYKQFSKDSTKLVKQQFKDLKRTTDSLTTELKNNELQSTSPDLKEFTSRQQAAKAIIDNKYKETGKYTKISRKELQTMVLQNKESLPEIQQYCTMINEELLPYRSQLDQYRQLPQSADSLKQQINDFEMDSVDLWQQLDKMVESEAEKNNYFQTFMEEQSQLSNIQGNPTSLPKDNNIPSFDLANHPMKGARQAGMKQFEQMETPIQEGIEKIDELKQKYAYVPDSEDLVKAKKSGSLQGEPIAKRLVFGGDFHIDIGEPLLLDFNPMLGYRLDKKWTVGLGGTMRFRLGHSDSSGFQHSVPATGLRAFGEYGFFNSFLAHAEYEVLTKNIFATENTTNTEQTAHSINIGLGNTFGIYKGLKGKFLLLYNFTLDGETLYRSPWVVRFGFLN